MRVSCAGAGLILSEATRRLVRGHTETHQSNVESWSRRAFVTCVVPQCSSARVYWQFVSEPLPGGVRSK
ncbi:hypothetical protein LX88_004877 [Lentzea californiensis]|nr:hypothetical protein [Lentzea californiensis]